jgi:hypothetical protein
MRPVLLGLACGTVAATVSIAGNLRRGDPHLVSTFPDLAAVLVAPAVLLIAMLRMRGARLDRDALGAAGRRLTVTAAGVFCLLLGAFAWYWLRSFGLATYVAGTSFISILIAGFVVSLVCTRRGVGPA